MFISLNSLLLLLVGLLQEHIDTFTMSLRFFQSTLFSENVLLISNFCVDFSSSSFSSKNEGALDQKFRFQVLQQLTPSGREVPHLASICSSQYLLS